MAVTDSDIELRYTIPGAGSGDSQAGTAAGSLGEYVSTTQIVSGTLHNLFDLVTGTENAALDEEYRCFAVCNTNATDTWTAVDVWIASQVSGGAGITMGLDPAGVVPIAQVAAQGAVVVDESTAPGGVTFTSPSSGSPLTIGDMTLNTAQLIWIKRTATASASLLNDGATVSFSGTT
jgi:hypothetical protein